MKTYSFGETYGKAPKGAVLSPDTIVLNRYYNRACGSKTASPTMGYRNPRFLKLHSPIWFFLGCFFLSLNNHATGAQSARLGKLHKAALQNIKNAIVFVFRFGILSFGRLISVLWHKLPLVIVFIYFSLYFNPFSKRSSSGPEVWCPDGYAYKTKTGRYIKCEDFDEFHDALYNQQKELPHLYIDAAGSTK